MPDSERTEENRRYNSNVADLAKEQIEDTEKSAKKTSADKGETKVTTSTEGSVERTTERSADRG